MRGRQFNLGHLADSFSKLDGTGRVLDPVAPPRDDLLVVPATPESKKKVLKTIAAFASGEGGTVLFGITDDAQVAGLNPAALDRLSVAVTSMIRDTITPEPPYTLRAAELDGKTLLLAEVSGGGRWYAVSPPGPSSTYDAGQAPCPPAWTRSLPDSPAARRQPLVLKSSVWRPEPVAGDPALSTEGHQYTFSRMVTRQIGAPRRRFGSAPIQHGVRKRR